MRKWRKYALLTPVVAFIGSVSLYFNAFTVPDKPEVLVYKGGKLSDVQHCIQTEQISYLDNKGTINLVVWNIYKQNRENWEAELSRLATDRQLLLLQEVSFSEPLMRWIDKHGFISHQVNAFEMFQTPTGVVTLSHDLPLTACGTLSMEPLIRLPKSFMYSLYPLSSGETLAVVNLHGVNFTIGTSDYRQQLNEVYLVLKQHSGPVVLGGDFNAWSDDRAAELMKLVDALELQQVPFKPDNRTRFLTGLSLDFLFIRGLELINTKAPVTDASDHNPLVAELRISEYTKPR